MKKVLTAIMAAMFAGIVTVANAAVSVDIPHDTTGVRPGYWTSDFEAAKALSDEKNIPLLSFWGYENCAHCMKMKSNGLTSDLFKSWVAKKPIILVYTETTDATRYNSTPVKVFTRGSNPSGDYPFMRCYWPKADGTLVSSCFSGNSKQMPVTTGILAEQLVGTLDKFFGSWSPEPDYAGGYFMVTNMPHARLEAVAGKTTYVSIPLYRTAKTAAKNKFQAGGAAQVDIDWAANVTNMTYRYAMPANAAAGTVIALKLLADDGTTVKSTSAINVVAEADASTENPKWIGESFDYGEWTMDYDAAKKKDGFVLAQFGGALWCPDCYAVDTTLFKKGSEFYTWAKRNNISLVVFDQGNSDSKTPQGTGGARLLTYTEGKCYYLSGYPAISGASYLSRKGLSATDAAVVNRIAMTTKYTTAWKSPDSTAVRMSNPEMVLVKDDKVVARFNAYETSDRKSFDVDENMERLNALLVAAREDAGDANDFLKTATQTLAVEGSAGGSLQINNPKKFYKLTNVPAGKVTFTVSGYDARQAAVKPVLTVYDGNVTNVLGTGEGSLTVTFANGSGKFLSVSYFTEKKKYGSNNSVSYQVGSSVTLVPSQYSASFKTTSGKVNVTVTAGTTYKLSGFDSYADFTANGDGTYRAKKSGTVAMSAKAGSTVTFQVWTPGTVSFGATTDTTMEADGSGTITVNRTGGVAGKAVVSVSVDKGSIGSGRVSVTPATLTWNEGDGAAKTLTYKIAADSVFNPDETFTISLAKAAGSEVAVGSPAKFTLRVTDTDDPVLPESSYSLRVYKGVQVSEQYGVSNIKENGRVTLGRDGALPAGLKLNYYAGSRRLALEGKPTRPGTYRFSVAVTEARAKGKAVGQPTTFNVVVVDPATVKKGEKGYNVFLASGATVTGMVPVYGKSGGSPVLAGTMELRIAKNGRVSAKFAGVNATKFSATGNLSSIADDGTASATLEKKGARVVVRFLSDGRATVTVTGVSSPFGSTLAGEESGAKLIASEAERAAYAGYYTVTLPTDTTGFKKGGEIVPTGTGYVVLKMNARTFASKGRVNYSGVLPSGKAFSGYSYINPTQVTKDGAAWGYVPIMVNKLSAKAGIVVRVRKDAMKMYKNDPAVVLAADAAVPYWVDGSGVQALEVYGGCFERNLDFASCCQEYYSKETFDIACDTPWYANSSLYGKLRTTSSGKATVGTTGRVTVTGGDASIPARFSISRTTGVVTGTIYASFENGRKVRLSVRGVVLPGWTDCGCTEELSFERPFISAAAYYKDRVGGKTAQRGFAVEFR